MLHTVKEFIVKELRHMACRDRRDLPIEQCDLKFDDKAANDGSIEFEGYASKWDRTDSYGDTVKAGAFTDAIKARRPMMLYGHNPGRVVGKYMDIKEDNLGLKVRGVTTPGHSDAKDVGASLKFGAMNGLSIGGYTTKWEAQENGRIIKQFDLYEISVVSMPAEQEARIDSSSVKAMIDDCESISDLEELMREASGFSKSMATAFVARLKRIVRGEPESPQTKADRELTDLVKGAAVPSSLLKG